MLNTFEKMNKGFTSKEWTDILTEIANYNEEYMDMDEENFYEDNDNEE